MSGVPRGAGAAGPGHAIVTGAAGGIGTAIASLLAARGWALGLIDRDAEGIARLVADLGAGGRTAVGRAVDVTDGPAMDRAVGEVTAELAALTGPAEARLLVTNAGVMSRVPLAGLDADEIDRCYRINVSGTLLTFLAARGWLLDGARSSMVTVASGAGLNPASITGPAYRLAKSGIVALTRILAAELRPEGVRVNCVAPGGVDGGMSVAFTHEELRGMREAALGGRLATVDEVAASVAFLASDEAAFITGAVLPLTGGVVF